MGSMMYLIGAPASGKTTLFAELTRDMVYGAYEKPVPHVVWQLNGSAVTELGKRRDEFSGTDALSMSIQPQAIEFVAAHPEMNFIAEGDRLANAVFFRAMAKAGVRLHLFWLNTPRDLIEDRRMLRAIRGAPQNRTWLRGRDTKVSNLAPMCFPLPGELPVADQIAILLGECDFLNEMIKERV